MSPRRYRHVPAAHPATVECIVCGRYVGLNPHTVLTGLCGACEAAKLARRAPVSAAH
ncbi:hypothetical protein [Rhodococcus sp. NPDC003348]